MQGKRRFVFNAPTSLSKINEWEKQCNLVLPESYIDWLVFSNGSVLRGTLAEIYSLDNIIINPDLYPEDYVIIGSLAGDGELICFSKKTGEIFTDDHDDITNYDSFNELLEDIINDIKGMW